MLAQMNHLTEPIVITAASARLVIIVMALEPVVVVQQVTPSRAESKFVDINDCTEFVRERKMNQK